MNPKKSQDLSLRKNHEPESVRLQEVATFKRPLEVTVTD